MSKSTLVVGASPNPSRYSYKAVERLVSFNHSVHAYGLRNGVISGVEINSEWPITQFHTVTLYLNPQRQLEYYNRIVELKPNRVIFNPGTENPELMKKLSDNGIEYEAACTLVMLSVGTY